MMKPMNEGNLILPADPFEGLRVWIEAAKSAGANEPTAMTLATASRDGNPTARIVLYKGSSTSSAGREAAEFYTNYDSRKSRALSENPRASLVFHWNILRRQLRIEGVVEKVSAEESNRYFQSRARDSQIGAWSSPQSEYLQDRAELIARVEATKKRFGESVIPCPPFWGGWRLTPSRIEFWEERPYRLHERHEMKFEGGAWVKRRLAP
ncbi:pyridoxamine 5'-phosphate oxidase [soil metagenome]